MRTSNKILLSAFVIALLIFLGIYSAIYVQYKRGTWTSLELVDDTRNFEIRKFEAVKYISILGLQNCSLLPSDTLKLDMEKTRDGQVYYLKLGDSLLISTDTIVPGATMAYHQGRQRVKVYVPSSVEKIIARECNIEMYGNRDSTKAYSQAVILFDTWLNVGQRADLPGNNVSEKSKNDNEYWNYLTIEANSTSKVNISYKAHIIELRALLWMSDLIDQGSAIQKLSFEADKKSQVTLHGDNLVKATLTSK